MTKILHDAEHDVRAEAAGQSGGEDERFMRMAIEEARRGDRTPGAGEVGCVIVRNGEVLARGHNEAELQHDPTAHAEIVTMRRLGELLKTMDFSGCTVYCTLQPCSMCTAACVWGKISRIVYGATRNDVHSMYFDARHVNTADLVSDAYRDDIEIAGGVLADECAQLYYKPQEQPRPAVNGVLETALYVEDLPRAQAFYERVFGFSELYREEGRLHALSVADQQVLLLFKTGGSVTPTDSPGGRIPAHDGRGFLHLAFEMNPGEIDTWRQYLQSLEVPIESEVDCPQGGHSIYLRDPDHHLLELVTRGCWRLPS